MAEGDAVFILKLMLPPDRLKLERLAVQCCDQVRGQDGCITARIGLVKIIRFAKLAQINLISQSRQIFINDGKLINFEPIVHLHEELFAAILQHVNHDGAVMTAAWDRVSMETAIHAKKSKQSQASAKCAHRRTFRSRFPRWSLLALRLAIA